MIEIYYIVLVLSNVLLYIMDKLNHNYVMHSLGEGQTHSCTYGEGENIVADKYYFRELSIDSLISGEWYNIKIFFKLGLL